MPLDQKKFDGYGLTISGMVTKIGTTKKGKIMMTILAGSETVPVLSESISKNVGEDYHAKVNCFVAGSGVMFSEQQIIG